MTLLNEIFEVILGHIQPCPTDGVFISRGKRDCVYDRALNSGSIRAQVIWL